ncbi:MAG: 2-hydroxyacid dehydrogenase [Rhodobacteraceae bacterium]|nr:2-hydroxyacid dehydrogenase [Paracoccaceae bacterium]
MALAEILMLGRAPAIVGEQLSRQFTVHRAGPGEIEALSPDLLQRIRGIASGAHVPVNRALIERMPGLEIVANFGVGYDSVDAAFCGERGICVTNTPDVLTEEVADTAFGLLLMTVRQLSAAERYLRAGRWEAEGPYPLTPATLRGRTLGILGLGRIGLAIARRAEAFGLEVRYHGRTQRTDVDYPYHDTLEGLARACDTLMVVAPGGEATRGIVDRRVLTALGPEGIVVNVGRGTVIDEPALVAALQDGTILSAGLDVFEKEPKVPQALKDMEHVVLLPHVGSASRHTRDRMGQLVVDNLASWFRDGRPLTPVAETPFVAKG